MKKFFKDKVTDYKFKKAGAGHKLNEEKPVPQLPQTKSAERRPPSSSASAAGQAALSRLEQKESKPRPKFRSSVSIETSSPGASRSGGKTLCAQPASGAESAAVTTPTWEVVDTSAKDVVVHLICPLCRLSISHSELLTHYQLCLQEEYLKEGLSASVLMIHTLCQDISARQFCVTTLSKYLSNIITHPGEEKYTKIPTGNKTFKDKVEVIQGATLFLEAVGFKQELITVNDVEQQFYVLPMDVAMVTDNLETCKELLTSAEPLKAELDRNLQVFRWSKHTMKFELPREFYNLTIEEIRSEQKQRSEVVERESLLRTRAMRERDETIMTLRHYRYTLVRVRMPSGLVLQAVFKPSEKVSELRTLLSAHLVHEDHTYTLSAVGKPLPDDKGTFASAGLVPSAMVNFSWVEPAPGQPHLSPELLARVQEL